MPQHGTKKATFLDCAAEHLAGQFTALRQLFNVFEDLTGKPHELDEKLGEFEWRIADTLAGNRAMPAKVSTALGVTT